MWLIYAKFYVM